MPPRPRKEGIEVLAFGAVESDCRANLSFCGLSLLEVHEGELCRDERGPFLVDGELGSGVATAVSKVSRLIRSVGAALS